MFGFVLFMDIIINPTKILTSKEQNMSVRDLCFVQWLLKSVVERTKWVGFFLMNEWMNE